MLQFCSALFFCLCLLRQTLCFSNERKRFVLLKLRYPTGRGPSEQKQTVVPLQRRGGKGYRNFGMTLISLYFNYLRENPFSCEQACGQQELDRKVRVQKQTQP